MERKNIKRNANRRGVDYRPFIQGVGFGGRITMRVDWTPYEKLLRRKGLY